MLREADACSQQGEVGALLRREGLYSSHLSIWRKQRDEGALEALAATRAPPTSSTASERRGSATPPAPSWPPVGSRIEPLVPSVERTGTATFTVAPALPGGIAIDPSSGVISGAPAAKQPARTYTVTLTDLAGSATAPVSIRVEVAPRRWKVVEQ